MVSGLWDGSFEYPQHMFWLRNKRNNILKKTVRYSYLGACECYFYYITTIVFSGYDHGCSNYTSQISRTWRTWTSLTKVIFVQRTKYFNIGTCPARQVTYNFHSSCKHMHLSFKSVCNKEHKGVIWLPRVILPKALVLQDECFGKNYSSYLDFTWITSARVEFLSLIVVKGSKETKIRNRYNQVPQLTQDTTWESDKNMKKITYKRAKRLALSQQVTIRLQLSDKKAWQTRNINNKNDPQKKHHLGTVSKNIFTVGLKLLLWYQLHP